MHPRGVLLSLGPEHSYAVRSELIDVVTHTIHLVEAARLLLLLLKVVVYLVPLQLTKLLGGCH